VSRDLYCKGGGWEKWRQTLKRNILSETQKKTRGEIKELSFSSCDRHIGSDKDAQRGRERRATREKQGLSNLKNIFLPQRRGEARTRSKGKRKSRLVIFFQEGRPGTKHLHLYCLELRRKMWPGQTMKKNRKSGGKVTIRERRRDLRGKTQE